MSAFIFTEGELGLQPITDVSTTQRHPLGTRRKARDTASTAYGEGEFIYLQGVASTAVGSCVVYFEDDHSTVLLDTDSVAAAKKGQVAWAMSACVASSYGWYQIAGKAVGLVLAAFADNADVYATSTGGSVDDAVVDGYMVHKCRGASAIDTPSTGFAELEIQYPYVDGVAGND